MLVLSRKVGERLFVGEDISITVTKVRGNRIVLGIDAPGNVPILRAECLMTDTAAKIDKETITVTRKRELSRTR